jgi:hypothetical protein
MTGKFPTPMNCHQANFLEGGGIVTPGIDSYIICVTELNTRFIFIAGAVISGKTMANLEFYVLYSQTLQFLL